MKRILIVEDDPAIARLESDYLKIGSYQSDIVGDGDKGLVMALANDYDLILLDVMLPGKDGYEICELIRRQRDIPILLVTARQESIDKIRGLGLGADDYIVKPFDPAELVARVNAHIARFERLTSLNAAPQERFLTFGNLKISQQSYRVYLGDEELRFTSKEFELLYFLVSNPNIVFSKDALFERIWGLDAIGDVSTITVHIKRIREKIEADPSNPQYIQTIWGVGYRFNA